jgi:UDP-N-acetylmuramyl pentapeptide phosphotransferase/UDP-N-acetylglucosamine-1-phosphate transferase
VILGWSASPWLFGSLGFLAALVLAGAWRHQALRRQWLDLPGDRRLHELPTPRGGGIAVAAVILAATPGMGEGAALVAVGLLLTAGAGLIDDLRPLAALPKLGLQAVGVLPLALAWPLAPELIGGVGAVAAAWMLAMMMVNFWNFMDGSNGMAASQALLVGLAVLLVTGANSPAGWLGLAVAAGCLGFLPYNLPTARLFLGDVGSFSAGYAVAAMLLMANGRGSDPAWFLLLLPSAVLADAGLTLLGRLRRRRKVWLAHREHLYQRAILHGWSHLQICLAYAGWTALAAWAAWAVSGDGEGAQLLTVGLFAAAAASIHAWAGRRWPVAGSLQHDMESAG